MHSASRRWESRFGLHPGCTQSELGEPFGNRWTEHHWGESVSALATAPGAVLSSTDESREQSTSGVRAEATNWRSARLFQASAPDQCWHKPVSQFDTGELLERRWDHRSPHFELHWAWHSGGRS
jgi:hypothetical protein